MVLVEAHGGDRVGLGYTYGDAATGTLVRDTLAGSSKGRDALAVTATWQALGRACRNLGRPGLASMAIAAVDTALWDLKARLLELPLATLLDAAHDAVPVYGSGGFTSYPDERLAEQLGGWVDAGDPAREDEGRPRAGARPPAGRGRARGDRRRDGAVRRRERRAQPQAGAAVRGRVRGALRRALVRGAGQLGRPRRSASDPRPGAGRDGDRRRRVRLHAAVLRADARGGRGRLPAGGRHPLRGDHAGSCASPRSARRARSSSRRTAGRRSTCIRAARSCRCATSSTSTTTCGSSGCSSTASSSPSAESCGPTSRARATGSSSSAPTPRGTRSEQGATT